MKNIFLIFIIIISYICLVLSVGCSNIGREAEHKTEVLKPLSEKDDLIIKVRAPSEASPYRDICLTYMRKFKDEFNLVLSQNDVHSITNGNRKFNLITEEDNIRFIKEVKRSKLFDDNVIAVHFENSLFKHLSDNVIEDKAITYPLNVLYFNTLMKNAKKIELFDIKLQYVGFKSIDFIFVFKSTETRDVMESMLDQVFSNTNKMYEEIIENSPLKDRLDAVLHDYQRPSKWFIAGVGDTSDKATAISKTSLELIQKQSRNRVLRFREHEEYLKDILIKADSLRVEIQKKFIRYNNLLVKGDFFNKYVLSEEVNNLIRKTDQNDSDSLAMFYDDMKQIFKIGENDFSSSRNLKNNLDLLIEYNRSINVFTSQVLQKKTQLFDYAKSTHGGMSVDVERLGALGQTETMRNLIGITDPSKAVQSARDAYWKVNKKLRILMNQIKVVVRDVTEKSMDRILLESGDEFLCFPSNVIGNEKQRAIIKLVKELPSPFRYRMVFFPEKFYDTHQEIPEIILSKLVIKGENFLKILKKKIRGKYGKKISEKLSLGLNIEKAESLDVRYHLRLANSDIRGLEDFINEVSSLYMDEFQNITIKEVEAIE